MSNRALIHAVALTLAIFGAGSARTPAAIPHETSAARDGRAAIPETVASHDFDENGVPDPEGWTPYDLGAQSGTYFHVDDFAGMGANWSPISGSQSLWCGTRGISENFAAPGYGNLWHQQWVSDLPTVTLSDITIEFDLEYDLESSFDFFLVEHFDASGPRGTPAWSVIGSYDGSGQEAVSLTVSSLLIMNPPQFRLRLVSDLSVSNEDGELASSAGGVIVDNLLIKDQSNNIISFEDFEGEAAGATTLLSGTWSASPGASLGLFAGVVDGTDQVQEVAVRNDSGMLAYFVGSSATYACGGFPQQAALPQADDAGYIVEGLQAEMRSPVLDLSPVQDPADEIRLEMDVYQDLPFTNGVFYTSRARFFHPQDGWSPWTGAGFVYFGSVVQWTHQTNISFSPPVGSTQLQLGIQVTDTCADLGTCGAQCRGHAPMIDNVEIIHDRIPNTPVGSNVVVTPLTAQTGTAPISLTFDSVTAEGITSVDIVGTAPPSPPGFTVGSDLFYDIQSTAAFTGDIEVCLSYEESDLLGDENELRFFHFDESQQMWVDETIGHDPVLNTICGNVDHFSPFALMLPSLASSAPGTPAARSRLGAATPNPFSPSTTIRFELPAGGGNVRLAVYNAAGRLVTTLVDAPMKGGPHSVGWNGRDSAGRAVASGSYFYRLEAGGLVETRKMTLLK